MVIQLINNLEPLYWRFFPPKKPHTISSAAVIIIWRNQYLTEKSLTIICGKSISFLVVLMKKEKMHALCIHFKCFASFLLSFYRMLGFKLCLVGRDQFPLQQQQISCQNLERHSKQQDVCLIFPPFLYLSIFHQCECIKCEDYRIFCQNYWYEISFGLFIM